MSRARVGWAAAVLAGLLSACAYSVGLKAEPPPGTPATPSAADLERVKTAVDTAMRAEQMTPVKSIYPSESPWETVAAYSYRGTGDVPTHVTLYIDKSTGALGVGMFNQDGYRTPLIERCEESLTAAIAQALPGWTVVADRHFVFPALGP
jgi:hypothetical protein